MKKNLIITIITLFLLPIFVKAGSIEFTNPEQLNNNQYRFYLNVEDINLNRISGNINLPNGRITNITMSSGWINKTGNNNAFYFYRDGTVSGTYHVATIEIAITDSGSYSINNLQYGINKCIQENNLYFGENGKIVSQETYKNTCGLSNDATLRVLKPSVSGFSYPFSSETVAYYMTVKKDTDKVQFKAETNHPKAKIKSGTTCNLNYGYNTCEIIVESERKNTKRYVVYVFRQHQENSNYDPTITDFQVHNGTLIGTFNQNTTDYKVNVNKNAKKIYFTFKTDGGKISHTSDSCNAYADSCSLTITLGDNTTRNYVFYFLNEDTKSPEIVDNLIKKPTTTPNKKEEGTSKPNTTINKNEENKTNSTSNNQTVEKDKENNPNQKEEDNKPDKTETKDPSKENKTENKNNSTGEEIENNNTIMLPLINIEISRIFYLAGLGVLIFALGLAIGVLFKKKNK